MKNLYPAAKLLVLVLLGALVLAIGLGADGKFLVPVLALGGVSLYFYFGAQDNKKAREAVAHVNNIYSSAVEGTGIGIAYAKHGSRPALQVFAKGAHGSYEPFQLRSVGLRDDRNGVYRNVLLMIKDSDVPEWIIHFKTREEATKWKERITQFAESGGGE